MLLQGAGLLVSSLMGCMTLVLIDAVSAQANGIGLATAR
jgi:hypothetical protein